MDTKTVEYIKQDLGGLIQEVFDAVQAKNIGRFLVKESLKIVQEKKEKGKKR